MATYSSTQLGKFHGQSLEGRFAVSGNVGCAEGVCQNNKYQNNENCQREFKAATKCVENQSFKQRVAAVNHKRHCKCNGEVGEEIFGFAINRNKLFSNQAGGNITFNTQAKLLCTACSGIAVSVKNQTVKRAGNQECEQKCCYGKD